MLYYKILENISENLNSCFLFIYLILLIITKGRNDLIVPRAIPYFILQFKRLKENHDC